MLVKNVKCLKFRFWRLLVCLIIFYNKISFCDKRVYRKEYF